MKLFYAPTSPYVRKVMVLLIELGLDQKVERITGATTPMAANTTLSAMNPLAKLPALAIDSGETLYDSRVICEYLDSQFGGGRFFPQGGAARWTALRRQALGDGLLDAALLVRYEETARPAEKRWSDWSSGQWGKVARAIDAIERGGESRVDLRHRYDHPGVRARVPRFALPRSRLASGALENRPVAKDVVAAPIPEGDDTTQVLTRAPG